MRAFEKRRPEPPTAHYLLRRPGTFVDLKVKPSQALSPDHRRALPVETLKEQWRLAARGPGARPCRLGAQPAFVHEDDDTTLPSGVFLTPARPYDASAAPACHHAPRHGAQGAGRRTPNCPLVHPRPDRFFYRTKLAPPLYPPTSFTTSHPSACPQPSPPPTPPSSPAAHQSSAALALHPPETESASHTAHPRP